MLVKTMFRVLMMCTLEYNNPMMTIDMKYVCKLHDQ